MSSQMRNDTQANKSKNEFPGVGSYNGHVQSTIREKLVQKYNMGYKGKFGITEKRFLTQEGN